uniref:Nuclear pore complex protein Nup153 n=1 Tax=Nothoprocta perdicaria TaxID=30464 RepID=A0A8C7A6H5_NOTPE
RGSGAGLEAEGRSSGVAGSARLELPHLGQLRPPLPRLGIISRVTESVKNIVPGWLQKYFNKSEDECVDTNESANQEENPVNFHHDYPDEDTIVIDGRVTPESARINLEEPSTSRSALNFSDVLTRPSLHRSHLNCTMLDSTVPHCQPSTSSALGIGSPGLSLVKEIKDSTSQHDDDNISTTSGFSSRASDKDIAVSKNTSAPPLWSTEAERSHSLSQHTAASSKKPAFNLSAFGALSPSLGNTSVFKTSQLGDSPFYPGKTTYGGAAASARQTKVRIAPYQTPVRRQMKAKQANVQSYGVTSSTARRILQSLEKMSSPLADAKRIPSSVSTPLSSVIDCCFLSKMETQHPPVQKLVTPKAISLSMSRTQYFKPSLSPATDSSKVRQRVDIKHKVSTFSYLCLNLIYPKFSTPASNGLSLGGGASGGGKMRRERGVHYVSKPGQEQQVSDSQVISFTEITEGTNETQILILLKIQVQLASNTGSPVFRFSSPIVKSTEAEVLPPLSIGFTFSVPVVKSAELSGSSDTPVTSLLTLDTTTVNSTSNKKEENKEEYDGPFKPAKVLKEGSVLDILKSPGIASEPDGSAAAPPAPASPVVYTRPAISSFSASEQSSPQAPPRWPSEPCDPCLQNKAPEDKCGTCQAAKAPAAESPRQAAGSSPGGASKPAASPPAALGFGDKFKTAPGTWDCDTCLVQNKPEATKCVACETPKPGTGVTPALTLPAPADAAAAVTSSSGGTDPAVTLGFGDKFKKPKGSWDCTVCLVTNKAEDSKCVACQSEKPGSSVPVTSSSVSAFPAASGTLLDLEKFKKPEGSWECEDCFVQNKAEDTKCVACGKAKPGTKGSFGSEPPLCHRINITASFAGSGSAPVTSNAATPSFTFGVQSSASDSAHTLGSPRDFTFREQGSFKFGIPFEAASSNTGTGGFKFASSSGEFKFGVSSSDSKSEDSKKEEKTNTFTFGLPSTSSQAPSTFQFGTSNLGQQEKKEEPVLGGFNFGTSSASSTAPTENKTGVSGFTFGTVAEKEPVSASFAFKKSDEKKDEASSTKTGFSFGNVEPTPASQFVLGRTEEKQDSVASAAPLVFGKKADSDEPKAQPVFSFGKPEHTKEESTTKATFNFSFMKPSGKEAEQAKPTFTFGAQTSTSDQGAAKSAFSFLSPSSSSPALPTSSAGSGSSSVFGGSAASSTAQPGPVPAPFVFGQGGSTVSSSAFGSSAEPAASQAFGFASESKAATTSSSTVAAVAPFVFGSGGSGSTAASSGFTFGATTTTSSAGSSPSFVFGSGSSAPATGPAFGAAQLPAFGQSPAAGQPAAPPFASLFPAAPPAFGSVASGGQAAPAFGQPAAQQPGFGPVFQFRSNAASFSFPSTPRVFTFGANPGAPAAPAQPAASSSFSFNQAAVFTVG